MDMFRQLSDEEAEEFIAWAREQYEPGKDPNPLWHPVVREEWARLDAEQVQISARLADLS